MIREKLLMNNVIQMAHDIRSPLFALQTILEAPGEFNDKKRNLLLRAATRLQEIADSILVENKNSIQETCLETLIQEILEEKKLSHKNAAFELKTEENKTYFKKINPTEMKRIISNLINNSIEAYAGKSAKIEVSLAQFGERVQIKVKDNGKKIPPIFLAKIFERGVSIGKKQGSGMGLAHAKEYIESIGGLINISSDEIETIVSIYL
jgi:signal transduction histidine kinase